MNNILEKLSFDDMCYISLLNPTKEMIALYKKEIPYNNPIQAFNNMLSKFTNTVENYKRLSLYIDLKKDKCLRR